MTAIVVTMSSRRTVGLQFGSEVLPYLVGQYLPRHLDECRGLGLVSRVDSQEELQRMQGLVELHPGVDEAPDTNVVAPAPLPMKRADR